MCQGVLFQGLCLIGETPVQASPAKYNLALPTTPAECNLVRPTPAECLACGEFGHGGAADGEGGAGVF